MNNKISNVHKSYINVWKNLEISVFYSTFVPGKMVYIEQDAAIL